VCLIVFAYHAHPRYALVVAANRDERYARPTAPAHYWEDAPEILAGRDLEGGGTWMGLGRRGRFAAVTNYREPGAQRPGARSRGLLVSEFLAGGASAREYMQLLAPRGGEYNPFSLVAADPSGLCFYSNRAPTADSADGVRVLGPGVYGLSNHLLDSPWPKVERAKAALRACLGRERIEAHELLALLADDRPAADQALPDTGIGLARERELSPVFVATAGYGTRSSTVLLVEADGRAEFTERTWGPGAGEDPQVTYTLRLEHPL